MAGKATFAARNWILQNCDVVEIVTGTVLAGEISLATAISSLDWVSSHDEPGRNDPTGY